MSVSNQIDAMIKNLENLADDVEKHDKGQKAAGTRIRAAMQTVKAEAQEVRKAVLGDQKAG